MPVSERRNSSTGFSLTEMLFALFVFLILMAAAGTVFDSSQDSLNWNYHQLTLQKDLRRILDTMMREIRESSPSSPNPITVGANTITFEVPSTVSGTGITSWKRITYGLGTDSTVVRTINGQSTPIGSGVTTLNFIYPLDVSTAPRTVQIQVTGQQTTLKKVISSSLKSQVVLRNS